MTEDGQMKTLVVYDSMYGNTEKVARAIAAGIVGDVVIKNVAQVVPADFEKVDLLFVGSPTQGGRPLKTTQAFIEGLSDSTLKDLKTGVFDTRMKGNFPKLFGWAAKRMADSLKKKGAVILLNPDGFFVNGSKGPVVDGELERATAWGRQVVAEAGKRA
jgi:flavodoxin I